MSALQRLQQRILANGEPLAREFSMTPKALRLHESLKREAYIRLGMAAVGGALVLNTGIASYDPNKLYIGDAHHNVLVQRNVYDKHRELLEVRESLRDIKHQMVAAQSTTELETLSKDLRQARLREQALDLDFKLLTKDLSPEEFQRYAVEGDSPLVVNRGPKLRG